MIVATDIPTCRITVRELQSDRGTVGLVPTMGALHEGHRSLIRAARQRCDAVAVTIFVNPSQFGPQEDYQAYPTCPSRDRDACRAEGVDLVFQPDVKTMYPGGELTSIHVQGLSEVLCGPFRPGHFDGVATVVAKLFNIIPADRAFFGEKDYQQLMVIRQMVHDLTMPIEIVSCPTVREPDGLALSSRNRYLSPAQREQAACLSRSLFGAKGQAAKGSCDTAEIVEGIRSSILAAGPAQIEYVEVVDALSLERLSMVDRPARICLAVRIGSCRLIDNVGVDAPHVDG